MDIRPSFARTPGVARSHVSPERGRLGQHARRSSIRRSGVNLLSPLPREWHGSTERRDSGEMTWGGLKKRCIHRCRVCSCEHPIRQGRLASHAGEPGGVSPRTPACGGPVRRLTPSGSPVRLVESVTDSSLPGKPNPPNIRSFHQARARVKGPLFSPQPPHPGPLPHRRVLTESHANRGGEGADRGGNAR